ncbi:39S ribosomal protein L23, mitochondrial isoform X2 [Octodon degus]|uniref:39S ribosomal protein L23, mitochondrial isoform X2 n=1 Tax=Octodon degus TaxID=10160 RepID=A0A6P6E2Q8_OCTDE|nr:39S ribosomal protein L23, mitochondrial isoform X2 [Octodon degus]
MLSTMPVIYTHSPKYQLLLLQVLPVLRPFSTPCTSLVAPSSAYFEPTSSLSWYGLARPSLKTLCSSGSPWSSNRKRDHRNVRIKKPDYKVAYVQLVREGVAASYPQNKKSIDRVYTEPCLSEWRARAMSARLPEQMLRQQGTGPRSDLHFSRPVSRDR